MLCFRKLSATKSLSIRGKYQDFSKKVCCLTVAKKFVRESFCAVFQKIVGNKKLWIRGECQNFPKKICFLTVLKNFVGEPLSVSLIWGVEHFYASEGYVTIFCRINFVSQYRKTW